MLISYTFQRWISVIFLTLMLCSCFQPPYNNFKPDPPNIQRTIAGAGAGAIIGTLTGNPVIGVAVGGTAGTLLSMYRVSKRAILQELYRQNIQFIEYGDMMTLIVPTDQYYVFNSSRLNDICYDALNNIIRLLRFYPHSRIYIAAFTDDVGSRAHKRKLSQARAETMAAFLWAHDIPVKYLHPKGYSDHYTLGNNNLIRGSAYNRRIEIQWFNVADDLEISHVKMDEK
jgi:outer membrane protein OmpA-like peptidoglycan-associated protein